MKTPVQLINDVSDLEATLFDDSTPQRSEIKKSVSIETIAAALRALPSISSFEDDEFQLSAEEQKEQIVKLSPYIPYFLQSKIAASPGSIVGTDGSTMDECNAAILAIEVSGFSTDLFTTESTDDELHGMFNTFFATIISSISKFDGDLLQFTGQTFFAMWRRVEKDTSDERIAINAASCALEIQYKLHQFHLTKDISLSLNISLGFGAMKIIYVWTHKNRSHTTYEGEPFNQILKAPKTQGQVLASHAVWDLIEDEFTYSNFEGLDFVTLIARKSSGIVPIGASGPLSTIGDFGNSQNTLVLVKSFIPAVVLKNRIPNGHLGNTDMNEVRRVTVLLISVSELHPDTSSSLLKSISLPIKSIQTTSSKYEGSISHFQVQRDVILGMVAFGLPGVSHGDDPIRAVKAALQMKQDLSRIGFRSTIAISTGKLFCGSFGSEQRLIHIMLGNAIDRVFKLAQYARDDVIADADTFQDSKASVNFEKLTELKDEKGDKTTVLYRPLGDAFLSTVRVIKNIMVGRSNELQHLFLKIRRLFESKEGSINIIEADEGMGKSTLVRELCRLAKDSFGEKITLLTGSGNPFENLTSYYAIRTILSTLFQLENSPVKEWEAKIASMLPQDDLKDCTPLFADIIPELEIPDNQHTKRMNSEARATTILDILVKTIQNVTKTNVVFLLIENIQWLDPSTWALVLALATDLKNIMILLTTRRDNESPKFREFVRVTKCTRISLKPLSVSEVEKQICNQLGIYSVPQQVMDLVMEKGHGNPFFTEELVLSLRDSGAISVTNGSCTINESLKNPNEFNVVPDSIQAVVNGRIDALSISEQMVLKIGSVLGKTFHKSPLYSLLSTEGFNSIELDNNLLHLIRNSMLIQGKEYEYGFKHAIIMNVAYSRMLYSQRKDLHERVATWYEENFSEEDLSIHYPKLAHHFYQADNKAKALLYYEKAGDSAMKNFAIGEAVEFFTKILVMVKGSDIPGEKMAHYEVQLGIAYSATGDLDKAYNHLITALEVIGRKIPSSPLIIYSGCLKQRLTHFLHRIFPKRFLGKKEGNKKLDELSLAYLLLSHISYISFKPVHGLYTALWSLNIAETLGTSAQLGKNYANIGYIYNFLGNKKKAAKYFTQGTNIAKEIKDPSCTMMVCEYVGVNYHGMCEWTKSLKAYSKLLKWSLKYGNRRVTDQALCLLAVWNFAKGNFNKQYQFAREAFDSSHKRGDLQQKLHSASIVGHALLLFNDIEEAIKILEDAKRSLSLLRGIKDLNTEFNIVALMAAGYASKREWDKCKTTLNEGMIILEKMKSVSSAFTVYIGLMSMCESLTTLAGVSKDSKSSALKQQEEVLQFYKQLTEVYPIVKSGYTYNVGVYLWTKGKPHQAISEWKNSLHTAEQLDTPYEQAQCLYAIGKNSQNQMSISYLDQAMKMFKRMGAINQLEKLKSRKREDHKLGASLTFDRNKWNVKKSAPDTVEKKNL